ncbi:hypothetical protein TWF594_001413 [Orbilia oligospora]|nr:hypothetical protein TWF594_001413 [Orbilia oligospora]
MLNTRGVDPLYDDDNGWNKHHIEAVYNGVWNESTKPTPYMGPLPAPSRLEYHWEIGTGCAKLDLDKLRIRCFNRDNHKTDNFMFPVPSRFYFEATFMSKSLRAQIEEWAVRFQIGLMASPFDTQQRPYRNGELTVYWDPCKKPDFSRV